MSASIQFRCFASRWFSPFTATIVSPRLGVSRSRDGWRVLHPSHELRVHRLCRRDSQAEVRDLQSGLLERSRRLDLGHGRRRVGIYIHAGQLDRAPRRDWPAGRRARILARGRPCKRKKTAPFVGPRLARARGDAEDLVRKTFEADLGLRGRPRLRASAKGLHTPPIERSAAL